MLVYTQRSTQLISEHLDEFLTKWTHLCNQCPEWERKHYQTPRNPHGSPCNLKAIPWGTALLIRNTMDQFCIFKNFIKIESYVIDSLLFGFSQSALCLWDSFMLHVLAVCSFSLRCSIPLYGCAIGDLSTLLLVDIQLLPIALLWGVLDRFGVFMFLFLEVELLGDKPLKLIYIYLFLN